MASKQGLSVGLTVGITIGVVVVLLLAGVVLAILYKLRRRKKYIERMSRNHFEMRSGTIDMHRYYTYMHP